MSELVKVEVLRGSLRLYFEGGRDAEEHAVSIRRFPEVVAGLIAASLEFINHHEPVGEVDLTGVLRNASMGRL